MSCGALVWETTSGGELVEWWNAAVWLVLIMVVRGTDGVGGSGVGW